MEELPMPAGIVDSLRDWMTARPEDVLSGTFISEVYSPSSFARRSKHPPARYPNALEGGLVGVIPNGRICGLNGAVITQDNQLIWDVSLEYVHPKESHSLFQRNSLPPVSAFIDQAADLTHVVGRNYYHWMYEVLPRVHLLKISGLDPGRYIVKSEKDKLPFQAETLRQLDITEEQLIKTQNDFHLLAERLVVPSQPSFATQWGYNFLRNTFLTDMNNPSEKKRIYIRRKWARRIMNEPDLLKVLEPFGFEPVDLESLPVAEQVRLFSMAEIVVAPHGAGLTNLTFCRPETIVIEIFSPTYITSLYWVISSFGKLRYYYIVGNYGGQDPEYSVQGWTGMDNITVSIPKFVALLKSLRI